MFTLLEFQPGLLANLLRQKVQNRELLTIAASQKCPGKRRLLAAIGMRFPVLQCSQTSKSP